MKKYIIIITFFLIGGLAMGQTANENKKTSKTPQLKAASKTSEVKILPTSSNLTPQIKASQKSKVNSKEKVTNSTPKLIKPKLSATNKEVKK